VFYVNLLVIKVPVTTEDTRGHDSLVASTLIDPSMRCIEAKNSIFPNSRCFSHPRNNQSKSESKFQNRNLVKLIYKKVLYNLIMLEVFIIVFVISTVL
jgi:hypothetical protein